MPESRARKRPTATSTRSARATSTQTPKRRPPSPPWVGISILTLFALGIIYLILYYVTGGGVPGQRDLGGWNILIGFGFIVAGFGLLTQWS